MRDLPRRGPPSPAWTRPIADRLTPAIRVLVIASTVLFLFYIFVPQAQSLFLQHLALGPNVFSGELWQPVTAVFVHAGPQAVISFIFNIIGLWWLGASVERAVGTRGFLQIFFISAVLANVTIAVVARGLGAGFFSAGFSLGVLALLVAFGRQYGSTQAQILGGLFLQARHLAYIFVAWALIADLVRGDLSQVAGDVVAVGLGFVLASGGLGPLWDQIRLRRLRRRYRVMEGGRSDKRQYMN